MMFGDFWQIPPVKQTSVTHPPFGILTGQVRRVLDMFWKKGSPNFLTHTYMLTKSHRVKDSFFVVFLKEAREGALSWNMYNFIHGYSTLCPGSWMPIGSEVEEGTGVLMCGKRVCEELWRSEWPKRYKEGCTWEILQHMEFHECQEERRRRARLLDRKGSAYLQDLVLLAPTRTTPPKCNALQFRAVEAAIRTGRQLLWCLARDVPFSRDDETRSEEAMRRARERWLSYPDIETAKLLGILPLSRELPMRFTESVKPELGASKYSNCI